MKSYPNLKRMQTFTQSDLPSLSEAVLAALELFATEGLPKTKLPNFKRPIIIGSGNAKVTSRILFEDSEAIFADENNFKEDAEDLGKIIQGIDAEIHGLF